MLRMLAVVNAVGACAHSPERLATGGVQKETTASQSSRLGPLFLDPQSADFTSWIKHFKNQVYRNWAVPAVVSRGAQGHVDIEFAVERNGSLASLKILRSSGSPALDDAAEQALRKSRFTALPQDYPAPRVIMQSSFFYNEAPR